MMKTPSKMIPSLLRLAALSAAVLFPAVSRADDLDTLLRQPPSASLTSEDAGHRIEVLRGFIAGHPDRQAEIEAYLIPFVRATQPPLAEPTPAPSPPPAKPKPLLLLKEPDGTATTMRAMSFRKQGAVIMVVAESGSHAVFQIPTVLGELPWYSEAELASGAVDLNELAGRYEAFVRAMPTLRRALGAEVKRLRAMQKTREDAAAEKRNTAQSRLSAATDAVYNPAAGYTRAALAEILLKAEKARNEMPEQAAKIDEWAAPFREHFGKLLAGQAFVKGAWVSTEDIARQAHEKRQAAFMNGLDYRMDAAPFSEGAVRGMLRSRLAVPMLALLAGTCLLVFGRKRKFLLISGAALLAAAPLATAAMFFLATRDPALLVSKIPMADEQPIVDVLSQVAGLDDSGATSHQISENTLNAFLARHVRIAPTDGKLAARQAVTVRLLPGRIAIFEMIRSLGLDWIVRLDLEYRQTNGKPSLALIGAQVGGLDCSGKFAAELWKNLETQFAAILTPSQVVEKFSISSPGHGTVELKPLAAVAPDAR